ncbi:hypothetical protein [Serratia marcescens]|uniref:hypothetical protein n=1 Tax=Serratia marcescens TaxID=615 RepID=UPI001F5BB63D|nr:hypothetical protein [Serratia marcescens]
MFSIIYHAGAAVLFLVMSLAAGAGLLLHGHEYTTGHFWNMTGLCIQSTSSGSGPAQAKKPGTFHETSKKDSDHER